MNNILDQIYEDYKKKQKNVGTHGVPNPHIEEELDFSKVRICECGSLNVSIDLSTNKTVCNTCGKSTDKPNKIDFQKEMEKIKEKESNRIEESMKRGTNFSNGNQ